MTADTSRMVGCPMFERFAAACPVADLEEYGYYDDGVRSPQWASATPLPEEAVEACHSAGDSAAVLVMTGAFDPMHEGHAEALRLAKRRVEYAGYRVVYTHVVPDSGVYARMKRPMGAGADEERAQSVRDLGFDCDYGSMRSGLRPNYTSVLLHVQWKWREAGCSPVVFNVVGSDNALFARVVEAYSPQEFGTVVVESRGVPSSVREDAGRNVFVCHQAGRRQAMLSSTLVRDSRADATVCPVMFVKDDIDYYTDNREFRAALTDTLAGLYESYGYEVRVGDYRSQVRELSARAKNEYGAGVVTLSMDPRIPADACFPTHRLFDAGALGKIGYIHDGELQAECAGADVVIVDDDVATGGGVQAVSDAVSRAGGRVVGVETVYACEGREYDVLDASDVTTISGAGLVVRDSGGAVCRVPYLPPFVDVTRFASVPAGRVGEFERAIVGVLRRFRVGAYAV